MSEPSFPKYLLQPPSAPALALEVQLPSDQVRRGRRLTDVGV